MSKNCCKLILSYLVGAFGGAIIGGIIGVVGTYLVTVYGENRQRKRRLLSLGIGALSDLTAMSTALHDLETEWSKSIYFEKSDFICPCIAAFRLADHSDLRNPLYVKMIKAISTYPTLLEYFREGLLRFRQNRVSEEDMRTSVSDMIRQTADVKDLLTKYLNSLHNQQVFGRFRDWVRRITHQTRKQCLNKSLKTCQEEPHKTPPNTDGYA